MSTIYELTGQFLELSEMMNEQEFDPEMISATLEGVEMEIEQKADGYAKVIKALDGDAKAIAEEISRLTAKKRTIENNIESMKRSLEQAMIITGKKKFKTLLFGFNIQANPKSLNVIDDTKIPPEFMIPQPAKLDRKAALDYIKLNGDQEWGEAVQTESLRIR